MILLTGALLFSLSSVMSSGRTKLELISVIILYDLVNWRSFICLSCVMSSGRTKLEPVSVIILSVIMALASLQLIRESVEKIVGLVNDNAFLPLVEIPVVAISAFTIG